MSNRVQFSIAIPRADRVYHVSADDVRVVLSRVPPALWHRLHAVHFNDRFGTRRLAYVNRGRREIAMCALPPRMSLQRALRMGRTPEHYGAARNRRWPPLAIRRFLLYDVFLHELGHLQVVDPQASSQRLKYARERRAEEFALEWQGRLWSQPCEHPDPVHGPPTAAELQAVSTSVG